MIESGQISPARRFDLRVFLSEGFERYGAILALGVACCLPFKLSLTYIFLLPLNVLWLIRLAITGRFPSRRATPVKALLFLLLIVGLSSLAGLDPLHSIPKALRFAFYTTTVFAFAELRGANVLQILGGLIAGQTLAALYSIAGEAFPRLPDLFIGKVTQSGQLALTIIVTLGVLFALNRRASRATGRDTSGAMVVRYRQERRHAVLLGTLTFLLLISLSFGGEVRLEGLSRTIVIMSAICATLLGAVSALQLARLRIPHLSRVFLLTALALPYLATALLVNLKRGPWLGVFVGGLVLLTLHARRYLLPLLITAAVLIATIAPLRTRLAESSEHFFIAGGRQVIWEIGFELSLRYPLGIGYENSPILRKFSPEIPPELIHFHNNLLQILVESGWFGVGIFLWWIATVIQLAFKPHYSRSEALVCAAIGSAVIAWQIAGLVEYNLGDSEVALVAFLVIGLMLKLKLPRGEETSSRATIATTH